MTHADFVAAATRDGYAEIVEREMAAGSNNTEHHHEFDARVLVSAGEMTITIAGEAHTYREGDTCAVPAGTQHTEAAGSDTVRYYAARRHPG